MPNPSDIDAVLALELQDRAQQNLYRFRQPFDGAQGAIVQFHGKSYINFCSNDYLGLASHPKIAEAAQLGIQKFGVGSGASHLVCGHHEQHQLLEEELAALTGRESALLFSTGFMANIGTINALVDQQDSVFQDKLNHASLLDGGLHSGANFRRFPHKNYSRLQQLLEKSQSRRNLVVSDAVFSMDGDECDAKQLANLCQSKAWLMLDDAHGFGVFGKNGAGFAEQQNLTQQQLPILMATFGKALGTCGAFVAGSKQLTETLIQHARSYIYTTAMPAAMAMATRQSLNILQQEPERREHLKQLIAFFQKNCVQLGLPVMQSNTAIQPLVVGDETSCLQISQSLKESGLMVVAIRPPTVPKGTSRLRVTLTAQHQLSQVEQLLERLHHEFSKRKRLITI